MSREAIGSQSEMKWKKLRSNKLTYLLQKFLMGTYIQYICWLICVFDVKLFYFKMIEKTIR